MKIASANLSETEKELQAEKREFQNLEQEQIRLEENESYLKEQISESRKKIESLEEITDSLRMKWKGTYPQNEISSQWIQQIIETADESIRKLQEVREASKDQKRSAERRSEQEQAIQRIRIELDGTKSQEEAISTEIEGLEDEIKVLDADFWRRLPDDFRGEDQGEALNQFRSTD